MIMILPSSSPGDVGWDQLFVWLSNISRNSSSIYPFLSLIFPRLNLMFISPAWGFVFPELHWFTSFPKAPFSLKDREQCPPRPFWNLLPILRKLRYPVVMLEQTFLKVFFGGNLRSERNFYFTDIKPKFYFYFFVFVFAAVHKQIHERCLN